MLRNIRAAIASAVGTAIFIVCKALAIEFQALRSLTITGFD
jgi:hypothetical protein